MKKWRLERENLIKSRTFPCILRPTNSPWPFIRVRIFSELSCGHSNSEDKSSAPRYINIISFNQIKDIRCCNECGITVKISIWNIICLLLLEETFTRGTPSRHRQRIFLKSLLKWRMNLMKLHFLCSDEREAKKKYEIRKKKLIYAQFFEQDWDILHLKLNWNSQSVAYKFWKLD